MGSDRHFTLDKFGVPAPPKQLHQFRGRHELPPGAVVLSEDQALERMQKLIDNWKPPLQMWPFNHGLGMMGGMSCISGIVFNDQIRRLMKLRHIGRFITFGSTVMIPTAATLLTQYMLVIRPILLDKYSCPLCLELRASCIQATLGVGQPLLLSLVACSALARQRFTTEVPLGTSGLFEFYRNILKKSSGRITMMLALNMIGAMLLSQEQGKAAVIVREAMVKGL